MIILTILAGIITLTYFFLLILDEPFYRTRKDWSILWACLTITFLTFILALTL